MMLGRALTNKDFNSFELSELVTTSPYYPILLISVDDSIEDGIWLCTSEDGVLENTYIVYKLLKMTRDNADLEQADLIVCNSDWFAFGIELGVFIRCKDP